MFFRLFSLSDIKTFRLIRVLELWVLDLVFYTFRNIFYSSPSILLDSTFVDSIFRGFSMQDCIHDIQLAE